MHLNSKLLFEKYTKPLFKSNMRVLEIGPDENLEYKTMVGNDSITWETLDVTPSDTLTYCAESEYRFPIADNTFDIVLSCQVIEHVRQIWTWINEVARVCKKGGRVIIIAPVSTPFHEHPVDCWRIYPEGMKTLYEEARLTVELCKYETLEMTDYKHIVPGKTRRPGSRKRWFRRFMHWRIACCFDTIAIGVKE